MKSMRFSMMVLAGKLAYVVLLAAPVPAGAFEPPKDPCTVLTAQEAGVALGATSTAGRHVVATLCEWDASQQTSASHARKLTLGFLSAAAWEQTKALREQMKGISRSPVADLGEEAVFSTVAGLDLCNLQVKKGSAVLDIHLYGVPADQARSREVTLARAALGRF
jgi:hypothetical protein